MNIWKQYGYVKMVCLHFTHFYFIFFILIIKAEQSLSIEGYKFKFIKLVGLFIQAEKNQQTEK